MKKTALSFVLKVWLSSVILSPLIMLVFDNKTADRGYIFLFALFLGQVLSVPSALLLFLICRNFVDATTPVVNIKAGLTFWGIVLTLIPFWILGGFSFNVSDMQMAIPYVLTIVAGIWIYRIELDKPEPPNTFRTEKQIGL